MNSRMDFTDRAQKAVEDAMALAEQYGHSQLVPVHLAVSLLDPPADPSKDQQNGPPPTSTLFRQVVERAHGDLHRQMFYNSNGGSAQAAC
jgi:ATP-dependent Clp protease ATP-binding subunit ClpB